MKRPLRFCLPTTFYPPFNFGGDGIDVERLARALTARGHHVTVVHDVDAYQSLSRTMPAPPAGGDGIEVIGFRSRLGVVSTLLTQQTGRPIVHGRRLARLFRDQPFDVVTFNNVSLIGGPGLLSFGGDAVRLYLAQEHWLVCPTHVLWRHNREACTGQQCLRCVLAYRRPPQLWRYTGFLGRQLRHVDVFVARSEFSRQKHREFGFPRPMEVLPYFLPGEFPEDPPPIAAPPPHHRPYFLFVGRLERIKGLDTVIPVFARYPEADLLVIGDGEEAPALRALAAGNPRVRFVGRVPNAELDRYYQHAIAAIVPSVGFETFGIVLIEAFRYQTPVIARRIGPFPEIIEQSGAGELFSDADELIAAMRRLQRAPEHRAELGARAYRACRDRWSEEVVVSRYLDLVARAAHERAARRGVPAPDWVP
ncbi:MAG TPA: glycosyltransferase family 4 protein [Vicinamibacterales bacterium]|nr:glycosyltransferase family 4 protein [Vicinamibacterales bacterium]